MIYRTYFLYRAIVLLGLMSVFAQCFYAQNEALNDSIENLYANETDIEQRLVYLSDLVKHNYDVDTAFAMQAADRFLKLATAEQDTSEMARGYNLKGIVKFSSARMGEAITHYLRCVDMYTALKDTFMLGIMHNNIASAFEGLNRNEQALAQYDLALEQFYLCDSKDWQFNVLANITSTHFNTDNSAKSLSSARELEALLDENSSDLQKSISYSRLGGAWSMNNQPEKAIENYLMSIKFTDKEDKVALGLTYNNLAECVLKSGDAELAKTYCKKAEQYSIHLQHEQYVKDFYETSYLVYKANGDPNKSLQYLELLTTLNDSVFNAEADKRVLDIQTKYETEKKDQEIELSQLKLAQQDRVQTIIIGGLIVLAALLAYAIYLARSRKTYANRLEVQKGQLEKALSEKEILLREIHHRVKNNLQGVSSLLSIQSREIEDDKALEAVKESQNRVKSMALIHQNLYSETNLTGIEMKNYVEKLANSLTNTYKVNDAKITLTTQIEDINLDVDTTIPLGLILNELITNSLKYAFPGDLTGEINVKLTKVDDVLELEVKDNGVGLSNAVSGGGTNFGTKMIKAFAKKLNATFSISEKEGTLVTLSIANFKIAG